MTTASADRLPALSGPPVTLGVSGLALSRGGHGLFTGLDLALAPGDALLLTGPNGTGKTSLLRALAGFVGEDSGTTRLTGEQKPVEPGDGMAWLGHVDGLKPSETLRTALRFWTTVHGTPRDAVRPVLRLLDIDHLLDRPAGRLSRGQQRRAGLARVALSGRPLWLLDEPAGPLDGDGRDRLAELVAQHRARGGSVIAATHQHLDWPDARRLELGGAA